jgi:hypothetical protein
VRNTLTGSLYVNLSILTRKSRAIEADTRRASIRKAPDAGRYTRGLEDWGINENNDQCMFSINESH